MTSTRTKSRAQLNIISNMMFIGNIFIVILIWVIIFITTKIDLKTSAITLIFINRFIERYITINTCSQYVFYIVPKMIHIGVFNSNAVQYTDTQRQFRINQYSTEHYIYDVTSELPTTWNMDKTPIPNLSISPYITIKDSLVLPQHNIPYFNRVSYTAHPLSICIARGQRETPIWLPVLR